MKTCALMESLPLAWRPGGLTWRRCLAGGLLLALLALLPLGTRLIVEPGAAAGHPVEWGTLSLYLTQLLAAAFVGVTLLVRPSRPVLAMTVAAPFSAAVLLATVLSRHPGEAAATAWWLLLGPLVWVSVVALRPSVRAAAAALAAAGCLQAVLGIWQFAAQAVPPDKWLGMAAQQASNAGVSVVEAGAGRWLRAYGTLPHPNIYGLVVAVALVVAVHYAMAAPSGSRRWWLHLAVGFLTAGLMFSYSRSAWLAAAVGLAVLMVAHSLMGRGWYHAATSVACVVGIAFVGIVAEPDLMMGRLAAVGRLERQSIDQRLSSYSDGQRLLADSPLTGCGPGLAVRRLAELQPARPWWQLEPPHFLPLAVASEVGLLGVLSWLLAVGVVGLRVASRARTPEAFLTMALLGTVGVSACFDHFFWTLWPGYLLFWVVMGLAVVAVEPRHD